MEKDIFYYRWKKIYFTTDEKGCILLRMEKGIFYYKKDLFYYGWERVYLTMKRDVFYYGWKRVYLTMKRDVFYYELEEMKKNTF